MRQPIVRIVATLGRCVMKNPAAGGGRWVDVPPERLVSWIVTFTQRHGAGSVSGDEAGVTVTFAAADGAVAECHPPFPPLRLPPLQLPPLQLPPLQLPPLRVPSLRVPSLRPAGSDDPAAIAVAIAAHA